MDQASFSAIQRHVTAGDYAAAEAVCTRMADAESLNPAFWQLRGVIASMAQAWTEAEAHFRWTIQLASEAPEPWLGLARVLIAGSRNDDARAAGERALLLGAKGDDRVAATEIVAHAKFLSGDIDGGRAELASLLPIYRAKLAAGGEVPPGALGVALCGGDAALAEQILAKMHHPYAERLAPMAIAPVDTLRNWCARNGVACVEIAPSERIRLDPTTSYSRAEAYKTDPVLFASIPNGQWVPGWDFAIAPDGTVLEDTGYLKIVHVFNHAPHAHFAAAKLVAHHAPKEMIEIDEDVLWLSAPMHNHVGYWLNDFLPRVLGRTHAGRPVKVAVPENLPAKFTDMLALAGVAESDLIRCRLDARYRFRTLHVYRTTVPPHPMHIAFLHNLFYVPSAVPPPPQKPRRFFMTRDKVATRTVVNRAAFDACLRANGFVTVDLGDLSIAQQRALFADAEVMLSALGTDQFAMYFAPPGCTVISMQWHAGKDIDPFGPAMSAMAGMKHQFLLCPETRPSRNARHWLDYDFVVDCAELTRRMRELGPAAGS